VVEKKEGFAAREGFEKQGFHRSIGG